MSPHVRRNTRIPEMSLYLLLYLFIFISCSLLILLLIDDSGGSECIISNYSMISE